jgi:3-dehydroquinate synthetase
MSPAGTATIDYGRPLEFGSETFDHVIRSGPSARDDLAARFAAMDAGVFILVTTAGIPGHIVRDARYCLGQSAPVIPVMRPDGEEHKTLASIEKIGVAAQEADASRKPVIVVGLGGGGVLNMAAYFARNWGRGDEVKVVYLPTNLLAWADMSPTRKTSVNLTGGKGRLVGRNKIGSRITPSFVWTDAA